MRYLNQTSFTSATAVDQIKPRQLASFATGSGQTTTMPGLLTSAQGILAFLDEDEPELKVFALQTLNDDIDTVWTEVAGSLSQM